MKIVSGIRPTGQLHLGNYLGAIRNWIPLQEHHDCLFFIADLHALTTHHGESLYHTSLDTAAIYLACGINPGTIFIQSHIPEHSELSWILSCHTPLGWLNRMTQFKEKSAKNQDTSMLGLLAYPVLMAADVLLYHATHVPVGEDQKQHVELMRDIALSMNHHYKAEIFTIPEPLIQTFGARIMSLRDGTAKMGKSNASDFERINLWDSNDLIRDKIKKATSDPLPLPSHVDELENRKETANLLTIYALSTNISLEDAIAQFSGHGFSSFKKALTEALITLIEPIREKILIYTQDKSALEGLLTKGATHARQKAFQTLMTVKETIKLR